MLEIWVVEVRNWSREVVVVEAQSRELCQVLYSFWNLSREGIEREIQNIELGREGGRDLAREVVVLEVEVLERRKRGNIGWEIAGQQIRPKADNLKSI